mmetsp:Transcript_76829/g.222008  ORF Transcript_76829/g.222008 Transcript_76829/m.222008 type:complete len:342 (+) Transcript_76829:94-1119(+)
MNCNKELGLPTSVVGGVQTLLQRVRVLVHGLHDLVVRLLPGVGGGGQGVLHPRDLLQDEGPELFRLRVARLIRVRNGVDLSSELVNRLLHVQALLLHLGGLGALHLGQPSEEHGVPLDTGLPVSVHLPPHLADLLDQRGGVDRELRRQLAPKLRDALLQRVGAECEGLDRCCELLDPNEDVPLQPLQHVVGELLRQPLYLLVGINAALNLAVQRLLELDEPLLRADHLLILHLLALHCVAFDHLVEADEALTDIDELVAQPIPRLVLAAERPRVEGQVMEAGAVRWLVADLAVRPGRHRRQRHGRSATPNPARRAPNERPRRARAGAGERVGADGVGKPQT